MERIVNAIETGNGFINDIVWGPPMLILIVGVGIYLTIRLKLFQVTKIGLWMKNTLGKIFKQKEAGEGAVTPFQALTTALAATVGTGNMAGIATAIVAGGPGAVFWMWISAFFGMMTKYAEIVLSITFRRRNDAGEWVGGPMHYIRDGLGKNFNWLAVLFAAFGSLAAFGIGNIAQINSIATSVETLFDELNLISATDANFSAFKLGVGILVAILAALVIIGGLKRIAKVTERLVPFMCVVYIVGGIAALVVNRHMIGQAFSMIFENAFTFQAAAGGVAGYTLREAVRYGVARGVFSNEAGLGSAPIAHAAADTDHPIKQGMWGVFEVFMDTIVICTLTALVLLTSGLFVGPTTPDGAEFTIAAFNSTFGLFGTFFVALALTMFAFSTLLSWSLYGQRCIEFLFKGRGIRIYQVIFILIILAGSVMDLKLAWDISDTLNGLMALPNLIALVLLSGVVAKTTREYLSNRKELRD